ncbi:Hypothetical protein ACI5QL_02838 [Bacillus velezensis]
MGQTGPPCIRASHYPDYDLSGIRTIFFPTTFDVLLLAILLFLACALHLEWI